jgi:XRE family aerobic/anaerobic benzoate catabolism transcriptional regulator
VLDPAGSVKYSSEVSRDSLLATIGVRIRALRERRGLSRRQLSETSGVSERFLAQLESGRGNISLARFADVARALGTSPAELLAGADEDAPARVVALLGVRGAGKSTIGERLAKRRKSTFVEVDQQIEQVAGLSLGSIFELHGESYYRKLETEVLQTLLSDEQPKVLATGGSIVSHRENFLLLKESARTIWLRARPEDHWQRVVDQGDRRPMAENPQAFTELKALLAAREPLYAAAHHVIDTHGHTVDEVLELIVRALA